MKKIYLLALVVIGFSANSFAQTNAATTTASATIVTPISLVKINDLKFGTLAVGAGNGTAVITAAGLRSETGDVYSPTSAATVSAASFTVGGTANASYVVSLPTTITLNDGLNSMTVGSFTFASANSSTIGIAGTDILSVGATLNVNGLQAPGTYTSTAFTVTVNYN